MTSYLLDGWYANPAERTRLRTEVIDGAMDVAGMLLRAGVPPHRILRVALRVRSLVVIADPLMRGTARLGEDDRSMIARRLEILTDGFPELQGFVNDCIENVTGARDMTAFYLHLVHITRMMQLLSRAVGFSDLAFGAAREAAPIPETRRARRVGVQKKRKQKKTKKKAAHKKPAKKTRKEPSKKAGRKPSKKAGRKPGKKAGRKPGKKAGRKPGKKAGRKPGKKAGRKPGKKAGRKPGK